MRWFDFLMLVNLCPLIIASSPPIQAVDSRKLDENTVPGPTGEKCSPCTPMPPPPSPPPPALPPPSPKKPPSIYCPPPPSFVYIPGPPGNIYPIDDDYNNGAGRTSAVGLAVMIGCGLLGLLLRYGV